MKTIFSFNVKQNDMKLFIANMLSCDKNSEVIINYQLSIINYYYSYLICVYLTESSYLPRNIEI